jgi:hypothetical protein
MAWLSPTLQVKWGSYFKADPDEEQKVVTTTQLALGGTTGEPLITRRIAIEKIAKVYGIENVDAVLTEIDKEQDARAKRELDAAIAALAAQNGTGGPGKNPGGNAATPSGDSGRPASGKVDSGSGGSGPGPKAFGPGKR